MALPPETPQETPLAETPGALPAAVSRKRDQPATWPGNVPSQAQAVEVLRGRLNLVVSLPGARKLQEKLTPPEREVILAEPSEVPALCEALAVRWRLAAAQDLLLTAGGRVDPVAVKALLAEVEQVLEALGATSSDSPALGLAIDRTWETLSQEAVDFFGTLNAASAAQPTSGLHKPPKKADKPAPTKVTFQPQASTAAKGPPASRKYLLLALGVAVLGAGGYHGYNLMRGSRLGPTYPGAPAHTTVTEDAATGSLLVHSTLVGPETAEQLAWLEQQKARGMKVQPLGPGSYLVAFFIVILLRSLLDAADIQGLVSIPCNLDP